MTTITVVEPGFEILTPEEEIRAMPERIERAARTCYKSEDLIGPGSAEKLIPRLIKSGHHSVLEHCSITVLIVGDRSMSHQLVRHRLAAYSQESQRYCDYGKKGFRVICPETILAVAPGTYSCDGGKWLCVRGGGGFLLEYGEYNVETGCVWLDSVAKSYDAYLALRQAGIPAEDARSVLPNATKTEVVTTYNIRTWRHVFGMRAFNSHAQWQIKGIMLGIFERFAELAPVLFADLLPEEGKAP